jgi:chromosome segregation protein
MQEWMDSIYESQRIPQFEASEDETAEFQELVLAEDAEAGQIAVDEEIMDVLSDEPQEIQLAADIEADAEDNIEALLKTAQAAVVGGHRADAKLLVLKAAVRIARQQEDEAAERVSHAENELRENELALDAAHGEVQQFEQSVERAAGNISGVEQSREAERREIESLNERIRQTQATLSDIDAQIRELQSRRAEADNERQQIQEALKAVADRDAAIAAEVESLRAAEHEERIRLEETRQRAKGLQTHRTALERRMMEAREALARQRQSTQDIELTIEHIRESEAGPASGAGDMLF